MNKTTNLNDNYLTESLETLPEKIPSVLLFYTLKPGRKVDVRLEVTGDGELNNSDPNLMVELISQEGNLLIDPIPVIFPDLTASFTLPEDIKQGSYILQVTYQNLVLYNTTFDVVDEESARQMEEFDRGLEIQDQVYQAIEESNYAEAINLQKEAAKHFLNANNPELAASSWEDLADILYEKNELRLSKEALEKTWEIYSSIEELENREEILARIRENLDKYRRFISKIKAFREAKGLSQEGLAFLLDVGLNTIQKWEQGQGMEQLQQYWELSQSLDCKITNLIRYEGVGLSIQPRANIKELREQKNLTLEGLAFKLYVVPKTIQEWEEQDPKKLDQCIKRYDELAKVLDCNIDDLIEFVDSTSKPEPIKPLEPLPEN
jgi:transcriptional regulator with XRE-family HTH domain